MQSLTSVVAIALLGALAAGCTVTDREAVQIDEYYTRAQVDRLNAEAQCKLLARNLVQVSRCQVR